MSDTELTQALLDPVLVGELHAFLWTEPFSNRGARDDGWSCRDHIVVVGALLRTLGAEVHIRHGRCMFVQGPRSEQGLGDPRRRRTTRRRGLSTRHRVRPDAAYARSCSSAWRRCSSASARSE